MGRASDTGYSTWRAMTREHPDEIHPYWAHLVSISGAVLLSAVLLSAFPLPWWGWLIAGGGLGFAGTVIGSAVTAKVGGQLNAAASVLGLGYGVATAALGFFAWRNGFRGHLFSAESAAVWSAWLAVTVAGGLLHLWIWRRYAEIRDPDSPRGAKVRNKLVEQTWLAAFRANGFGEVSHEAPIMDRWAGPELTIRLDPMLYSVTIADVRNKAARLGKTAHQLLRERGEEGLGLAEVSVYPTREPDVIKVRVRTRDPLTETLYPELPTAASFPVADPAARIHLGRWDTGDPLDCPLTGPHKFVIGKTGSGKSTLLLAFLQAFARRPFVTVWTAGTSKFGDFIGPVLDAAAEVGGEPIVEMWGGGDSGAKRERAAAERVVAAAYLLYRSRSARTDLPEKQARKWQGSPEHPWVMLMLDEVDDLIKKSPAPISLPNGERLTIWDMLVDLGSKARSVGIEVVYATQRGTNDWFGGKSVNNLLVNTGHRFLLRTKSAQDMNDALNTNEERVKAQRLLDMNFALMANLDGEKGEMTYGKCELWDEQDLVLITELANRTGTLTSLGDDEIEQLGGLYQYGSVTETLAQDAGENLDTAKEILRAKIEGREPVPSQAVPPETVTETTAPIPRIDPDATWAVDLQHELDTNLEVLTEQEARRRRPNHPRDPEVLLAAIVDAWDERPGLPYALTAAELVEAFGLVWLDRRKGARIPVAAALLAEILAADPIEVELDGCVYRYADLAEVSRRLIGID